MSKVKQMPHVTVEQVLALRNAAIELEQERNELAAQVERLRSAVDLSGAYKTNQVLADILCETPPAALAALKAQWLAEQDEVFALVMANARRLIKAKNATSNGRLYMELFGTGMGTGRARSRLLGLNPDDNKTSYSSMIDHIRQRAQEHDND